MSSQCSRSRTDEGPDQHENEVNRHRPENEPEGRFRYAPHHRALPPKDGVLGRRPRSERHGGRPAEEHEGAECIQASSPSGTALLPEERDPDVSARVPRHRDPDDAGNPHEKSGHLVGRTRKKPLPLCQALANHEPVHQQYEQDASGSDVTDPLPRLVQDRFGNCAFPDPETVSTNRSCLRPTCRAWVLPPFRRVTAAPALQGVCAVPPQAGAALFVRNTAAACIAGGHRSLEGVVNQPHF